MFGYTRRVERAFDMFNLMKQEEIPPNKTTYVQLITGICNHLSTFDVQHTHISVHSSMHTIEILPKWNESNTGDEGSRVPTISICRLY